jgi:PqqD family protein of HPr-rel-A system
LGELNASLSCLGARLHIRQWEECEAVVYDDLTGDTHVVDALAVEILRVIERGALPNVESLVTVFRQEFAEESDSEVATRVRRTLEGLMGIGLVVNCPL